jgi:hypothetical protein
VSSLPRTVPCPFPVRKTLKNYLGTKDQADGARTFKDTPSSPMPWGNTAFRSLHGLSHTQSSVHSKTTSPFQQKPFAVANNLGSAVSNHNTFQ